MSYFGNAFDFNNDGRLDTLESALEFGVFMQVMDYEKNENLNENLIDAGLDPEELDDMDYFERREILENAGFDPDDFDF
jgi:hypothetical protein